MFGFLYVTLGPCLKIKPSSFNYHITVTYNTGNLYNINYSKR